MEQLYFAYPWLLSYIIPVFIGTAILALLLRRRVRYQYALTGTLKQAGQTVRVPVRHILFLIRALMLLVLTLLIARPQWLDTEQNVNVSGVDIVLTIDISGSMESFDDLRDQTSRLEAARREALDFIERRTNDPIGIVLFGAQALSKLPLTLDKPLLKEVVRDMAIGDVDPGGTALLTALATSINRLRESQAKSKVIVLLTDGMPSPGDPINEETVIKLAKQFGIKVYTLGVGRANEAYVKNGWGQVMPVASEIDARLLRKIADETGGKFYRVYAPADLKNAYAQIDQLEKTEINTTLFQQRYEAFAWFIWWVVLLFALELFLKMVVWRGLS